MAIDTFGIVTFGLKITRGHPGNLSQCLQVILGDVVLMIVCATNVGACVCTVKVEHVA